MPAQAHTHRYSRVNIGKKGTEHYVMQCNLPSCMHRIHMQSKLSCKQLIGKLAICNRCEEPFILNRRALRFAEPVCDDCVNKKADKVEESADKFFNDLMKDLG